MENVILSNGVEMPILGYGVFKITHAEECERCVSEALEAGYRHIDTAQVYKNEEAVGRAIAKSDIPREEIFLTTKIWISDFGEGKTYDAFQGSLRRLQTDYIDLVLIHQPFNDYYGAYRDLEKLYRQGKIRAIGVSNFNVDRYLDLVRYAEIPPMVNQVETHVFNQQLELRQEAEKYDTAITAWGPFAQGQMDFFDNETLAEIADKHDKSIGQIGLRYLVQQGITALPKTVHKDRMKENMDIFDFELDQDDMEQILALDRKETVQAPHWHPDRVKGITGLH